MICQVYLLAVDIYVGQDTVKIIRQKDANNNRLFIDDMGMFVLFILLYVIYF